MNINTCPIKSPELLKDNKENDMNNIHVDNIVSKRGMSTRNTGVHLSKNNNINNDNNNTNKRDTRRNFYKRRSYTHDHYMNTENKEFINERKKKKTNMSNNKNNEKNEKNGNNDVINNDNNDVNNDDNNISNISSNNDVLQNSQHDINIKNEIDTNMLYSYNNKHNSDINLSSYNNLNQKNNTYNDHIFNDIQYDQNQNVQENFINKTSLSLQTNTNNTYSDLNHDKENENNRSQIVVNKQNDNVHTKQEYKEKSQMDSQNNSSIHDYINKENYMNEDMMMSHVDGMYIPGTYMSNSDITYKKNNNYLNYEDVINYDQSKTKYHQQDKSDHNNDGDNNNDDNNNDNNNNDDNYHLCNKYNTEPYSHLNNNNEETKLEECSSVNVSNKKNIDNINKIENKNTKNVYLKYSYYKSLENCNTYTKGNNKKSGDQPNMTDQSIKLPQGVFYQDSKKAFCANWYSNGKQEKRYFSINKFGEEKARNLAIAARKKFENVYKKNGHGNKKDNSISSIVKNNQTNDIIIKSQENNDEMLYHKNDQSDQITKKEIIDQELYSSNLLTNPLNNDIEEPKDKYKGPTSNSIVGSNNTTEVVNNNQIDDDYDGDEDIKQDKENNNMNDLNNEHVDKNYKNYPNITNITNEINYQDDKNFHQPNNTDPVKVQRGRKSSKNINISQQNNKDDTYGNSHKNQNSENNINTTKKNNHSYTTNIDNNQNDHILNITKEITDNNNLHLSNNEKINKNISYENLNIDHTTDDLLKSSGKDMKGETFNKHYSKNSLNKNLKKEVDDVNMINKMEKTGSTPAGVYMIRINGVVQAWRAEWRSPSGCKRTKNFGINTYGTTLSKKLAIEMRARMTGECLISDDGTVFDYSTKKGTMSN
ncbi:hypothetical protein PFMALIP_01413 [Plasmodium falciparum MaliPS096_E11]|uniref:AP2/ERF domain-containing protein n=1 Tax=Plasmodium falciparum MaliPS096_E11 TaxID=1036727 RepID=A0A024WW04_PLAFA|nr:hypothetical protein PFMALIP_01413 [Plasmodium falciparum MaliPS096_E11]